MLSVEREFEVQRSVQFDLYCDLGVLIFFFRSSSFRVFFETGPGDE